MTQPNFPASVHHYFLEYLPRHKGLQSSTIRSYRDSLRRSRPSRWCNFPDGLRS